VSSIFQRLRAPLKSLGAAFRAPARSDDGRLNLAVELPGRGERPLWRLELQVHSEPHGDGERVHLRAHVQTNFASALRPALGAAPVSGSRALSLSQRAAAGAEGVARRALQLPLLRALAEPLLQHDLNTWVEVQTSSASLDSGRTLLPQADRLAELGIAPRSVSGPLLESWAGESAEGFAQLTLAQIDKRHLPPELQKTLGGRPFQMAAAIVNTVERK
jgi:hypothetical protein